MHLSIAIAGSSQYTRQMAEAINADSRFEILYLLTPTAKPQGRKKQLINNPLHNFALENHYPCVLIDQKIDEVVCQQIKKQTQPDILLVVDFGYLVPSWLVNWPKIAPVNIHPSKLPAWRGSSPAQMVLLSGEKYSSVSTMQLNEKLDQGPIISQLDFTIQTTWNSQDYYDFAFDLASQQLTNVLIQFAQGKILAKTQPLKSNTAISKRLTKEDSFIDWQQLWPLLCTKQQAFLPKNKTTNVPKNSTSLLQTYLANTPLPNQAQLLERSSRAFAPWPLLWTIVPTQKGNKRMKILSGKITNNTFCLENIQLEGKNACSIDEIKNWF